MDSIELVKETIELLLITFTAPEPEKRDLAEKRLKELGKFIYNDLNIYNRKFYFRKFEFIFRSVER
jgi:hypothetical protein